MSWKFLKNNKKEKTPVKKVLAEKAMAMDAGLGKKHPRTSAVVEKVILQPRMTEKSSLASSLNKYVFVVSEKANKNLVKKDVESRYGVEVEAVNIINLPAKERRRGQIIGWKPGARKAMVSVKKGQTIDLN